MVRWNGLSKGKIWEYLGVENECASLAKARQIGKEPGSYSQEELEKTITQ